MHNFRNKYVLLRVYYCTIMFIGFLNYVLTATLFTEIYATDS